MFGRAVWLVVGCMFGVRALAVPLTICCSADNDLHSALVKGGRIANRVSTFQEAVTAAPDGSGVLLLSDGDGQRPARLSEGLLARAAEKHLRIYAENVLLPAQPAAQPRQAVWERVVVASDAFGKDLPKLRILTIHAARFLPVTAKHCLLVEARVAGFDRAVFGLPKETWPLLYEVDGRPNMLVATAKLSHMVTARYAPTAAWVSVWKFILRRLGADREAADLHWIPAARPTLAENAPLPHDAEKQAQRRALRWFSNSKLFIAPSWLPLYQDADKWRDRTGTLDLNARENGDGSLGVLEGFSSQVDERGAQPTRIWIRADCNGEAAMAFSLAGDVKQRAIGRNLGDFLMFHSIQSQGERAKPECSSYGLIGWNDVCRYWGDLDGYGVYYGDDNARAMLGVMAAAATLKTDRWDARLLGALLGNLRTTGRLGFRGDRIDQPDLEKQGWRAFWDRETINSAPHFEAYLWACNLWAYQKTGFKPFLTRTLKGIERTMADGEAHWRWGGGSIERARMLLPLAWLVRVQDTPEHRKWLAQVADPLLATQDACGAIREQFGTLKDGGFGAPQSNEAYGTGETPIVQENGDPLADMLYTCNFAFIGLHEAAAATGEERYRNAENKLAEFLCRIQIRSETRPELDGAWFRAFDYGAWDYWGSNADAGWGAWSIESGWSVTWITSVLALRDRRTSLWDLTAGSKIAKYMSQLRPLMIPDDALGSDER